jgi:guanylate kinase
MTTSPGGRLVILSGPSCVGKSPLARALARLYPALTRSLQSLVLYNSRPPRPGETDGVDYHFRPRNQVASLRERGDMVVMDVRGDLQALDVRELTETLAGGDVFFEGNPFVGATLLTHPALDGVERLSVFMAPLSRDEVRFFARPESGVSLPALVTDLMRRKLLRRTRRHKGELSLEDLREIERRAGSAYGELRQAHRFRYVIANHDGEDSENWEAFYHPLGDARRALLAFAALLEGEEPPGVERWDEELLPPSERSES